MGKAYIVAEYDDVRAVTLTKEGAEKVVGVLNAVVGGSALTIREVPFVELYTHRNGEAEPPTEEGWYWVVSEDGDAYIDSLEYLPPHHISTELYYYGPISQPQPRRE